MIRSTINDAHYTIEFENDKTKGTINGKEFNLDMLKTEGEAHIIYGNRSFRVVLEKQEGNDYTLRVNGKRMQVQTKDKLALLLESMGLSNATEQKINLVKAPMPGLVLRVLVEPGQKVSKGDPLLVLEAMKMENMIKSPGDAVVSAIKANLGQAVEKNQVLIEFN
jgi:biotin carboxyl carrier protein